MHNDNYLSKIYIVWNWPLESQYSNNSLFVTGRFNFVKPSHDKYYDVTQATNDQQFIQCAQNHRNE